MKKPTKEQRSSAAKAIVQEMVDKGFQFVGDPRTIDEKIATVRNTLEILRKNPEEAQKRAPLRGMIAMHQADLDQLLLQKDPTYVPQK